MHNRQTYLGFIGYIFIGTVAVLIPAIMPFITEEYSATLSLAAIGLIFPARSAGGIVGNLLAGVGSDVIGRQRMVWVSALLAAGALGLAAVARPWSLFLLGFMLISAAQGGLGTGLNAMIADANRHARARALNILHGIYGVGAAISPLIIGYLIQQGLPWRWALGYTGVIWLVYAGISALLTQTSQAREMRETDEDNPKEKPGASMVSYLELMRQGPPLALFFIAFAYNGVAYSLLGWVAIFMQESAGLSTFLSISMISVFYFALTAGRFICAAITETFGYARILLMLAIGITGTYPLVVLDINPTINPIIMVTGVFLTGLSLSGLFPTTLAYAARLYPEQTGTVTGFLNVSMTLGAMLPPLWTGIVADLWHFQFALGLNYVIVLPLIPIAWYLRTVEQSMPR
ncbi:MAG: MFS transporter [Chloroflexota bacterium]